MLLTLLAVSATAIALIVGGAALLSWAMGPGAGIPASAASNATAGPPSPAASTSTTAPPSSSSVAASSAASAETPPHPRVPSATSGSAPPTAPTPLDDSYAHATGVVVIDAGHQATADMRREPIGPGASQTKPRVEGGTRGVVTHVPESRINLEVALRLQAALESRGVKVIMVRTTQAVDIPNSKRAEMANAAHAALFIRLHCDGAGSASTHGFLMLRPGANQWTGPIVAASKAAAADVDQSVLAATGAFDRGTQARNDLSGFNWSKVPTILVEMGVMTNPAEDRKLSSGSYQQLLADGMANGIARYLRSR